MKKILIAIFSCLAYTVSAQEIIAADNDTTVLTEYHDGLLWAYRHIGDYVVGMTNNEQKDDYGRYYQIAIFVKNLGEESILFDPEEITSELYRKSGDTLSLEVYTYDEYMKKIKNAQAASMLILGFSSGLNAGMAGYQTTYTTTYGTNTMPYTQVHTTYNYAAASAANIAATTQIMTLSRMMLDDKKIISQGYLKQTTIHPNEGIIGYMNIKHRKGVHMTVNIPIEGQLFSFDWDVSKKKKQ